MERKKYFLQFFNLVHKNLYCFFILTSYFFFIQLFFVLFYDFTILKTFFVFFCPILKSKLLRYILFGNQPQILPRSRLSHSVTPENWWILFLTLFNDPDHSSILVTLGQTLMTLCATICGIFRVPKRWNTSWQACKDGMAVNSVCSNRNWAQSPICVCVCVIGARMKRKWSPLLDCLSIKSLWVDCPFAPFKWSCNAPLDSFVALFNWLVNKMSKKDVSMACVLFF